MSWIRYPKLDDGLIQRNFLSLPFIVNVKGKDVCFFTDRDSENKSFIRCANVTNKDNRLSLENCRNVYFKDVTNVYESGGVCAVSGLVLGNEIYLFCSSWYEENNIFLTRPLLLILDQETLAVKKQDKNFLLDIYSKIQNNIGYYYVFKNEEKYNIIFESRFIDNGKVSFRFQLVSSDNLEDWILDKNFIINPRKDEDYISRPSVVRVKNEYFLAYSSKKNGKYQIEMKKSVDVKEWFDLSEHSFLTADENSWENDEVCYPFIFLKEGKIQMLYNGNKYGKAGAGLAIWSE